MVPAREAPLSVIYEDLRLPSDYRADINGEQSILLEIKSIERILPVHEAQTRTCLRLNGCKVALLMNSAMLKDCLRRFIAWRIDPPRSLRSR